MKKLVIIAALAAFKPLAAQFNIAIQVPEDYKGKELYVYTLNGSKDILSSKEHRKNNSFNFRFGKPYMGMLKVYFPETNDSFNLISENRDIKVNAEAPKGKISDIQYLDAANRQMNERQDLDRRKELILPALQQIQTFYKPGSEFANALQKEISVLSDNHLPNSNFTFSNFYNSNYAKYISNQGAKQNPTPEQITEFLTNSGELLETSGLMRPLLLAYLNSGSNANAGDSVDKLLKAVNIETPRGQTILSELIDIFDVYEMNELKTKYLAQAQNLKCTINDRLASTIAVNKNVEIGARFPNYTFKSAKNTAAKTVYDVKAAKKIMLFWASTCSHCEKEIPVILAKYPALKAANVEVIGLSLDTEAASYESKVKALPWINDAELKGWKSSYADTYNIHATPTYFILDKDNKIVDRPEHAGDVLEYFKMK